MTVQDVTMIERDVTGSVVSGGGMRMRGATGHGHGMGRDRDHVRDVIGDVTAITSV